MIRTAVVLDQDGGALKLMKLPFKFGVGGRFGDGRQWFPTVSLTDYLAAVTRLATDDTLEGPYNVVAPIPATNAEFTKALGRQLHRPTFATVPAFAVKLGAGELSGEVLGSIRATPRRLDEAGFEFAHPTVEDAARRCLRRRSRVSLTATQRDSPNGADPPACRGLPQHDLVSRRLVAWQAPAACTARRSLTTSASRSTTTRVTVRCDRLARLDGPEDHLGAVDPHAPRRHRPAANAGRDATPTSPPRTPGRARPGAIAARSRSGVCRAASGAAATAGPRRPSLGRSRSERSRAPRRCCRPVGRIERASQRCDQRSIQPSRQATRLSCRPRRCLTASAAATAAVRAGCDAIGSSRHHAAKPAIAAEVIHRPPRPRSDRNNPIVERGRSHR